MQEKISVTNEKMKKTFWKAIDEIDRVLGREKTITDVTKTACVFIGSVSRIYSSEVHEKALEFAMQKFPGKKAIE